MNYSNIAYFLSDTSKFPLGKLSKIEIAKGFEVLEEIQGELSNDVLHDLSTQFYTAFPHRDPAVINTGNLLQEKFDMLAVGVDLFVFYTIAYPIYPITSPRSLSTYVRMTFMHTFITGSYRYRKYSNIGEERTREESEQGSPNVFVFI